MDFVAKTCLQIQNHGPNTCSVRTSERVSKEIEMRIRA